MRRFAFSALLLSSLVACTSALSIGCSSGASGDEQTDDELGGASATAVVDIPFYFGVPKTALNRMTASMRKHPYPTAWNASNNNSEVGLRVIAVPNSAGNRRTMSQELAKSGVLQSGDVVLSFRPLLAETIPYAHIQMGTTHAGLARVESGAAHTINQPLDGEYNGAAFQAKHYLELGAFHIIRPRVFDAQFNPNAPARRARLEAWQDRAEDLVGKEKRPPFNSNYLAPATAAFGNDAAKLSTVIGKGLLRGDLSQLKFFCSELAYHLITLSNCSDEEISSAGDVAECTRSGAPFPMMNIAGGTDVDGLGEGPLLSLLASKGSGADLGQLVKQVFSAPNPESKALSKGHQDANGMLKLYGAIDGLQAMYPARAQNPSASLPEALASLANPANYNADPMKNRYVPPNYSPTAFVINSMRDAVSRQTDYVATVVFADAGQMQKAKDLSHTVAIPNTDAP